MSYIYSPEEREFLAAQVYKDYFSINENITDFNILSTIRYDPSLSPSVPTSPQDMVEANFFLFQEHFNRLSNTSQFFLNGDSLTLTSNELLQQLISAIQESSVDVMKPLKIRLLVSLSGTIKIELYDTPVRQNLLDGLDQDYPPDMLWDAYIDQEPLMISPFTSFKTTHRPHYTAARQRCLPNKRPGKEEVLVFNPQQKLMEGSITNVAIKHKDSGLWVTPPLGSGCLCGVARHFLLMNDMIKELPIDVDMIQSGDEILLFNGIMGVVRAKVV